MGHSSLLGIDRVVEEPAGRDTALLGPSDSSDTGSDTSGTDSDSDSDSGGTGERRGAGLDAGEREGADIGVDRVFSIDATGNADDAIDENEDPDLTFIDAAQATDPLDDETADPELADEDAEDDDVDAGERHADEDDGIPGAEPTRTRVPGKAAAGR